MKKLLMFGAALAVMTSPAYGAACRDAKGKFIKCATAAPAKATRCRLNGKFAKCTAPGAKPV